MHRLNASCYGVQLISLGDLLFLKQNEEVDLRERRGLEESDGVVNTI